MSRLLLPATDIALVMITGAQPPAPTSSPLEFQLEPEASDGSAPGAFTFAFVNRSDHDVRIPTPTIQCEDSFDGTISLHVKFTPLTPGPAGEGGGCAGDTMNWPPILERVKAWKVLGPRESLRLRADSSRLFYAADQPGTYEFWATYRPPSVTRLDQGTLRAVGIDFPSRELSTGHIVFVKWP